VHNRHVNGILGLLCKKNFPGMVEFAGKVEPAYTFEHYACVPDSSDRLCRNFGTKANRVTAELWVSL
jgi:hypothetical protein